MMIKFRKKLYAGDEVSDANNPVIQDPDLNPNTMRSNFTPARLNTLATQIKASRDF